MPYEVKLLNVTRGDSCERAISLTFAGPPVGSKPGPRIPMPAAAVTQLKTTYTLIEAQFKTDGTDEEALVSLSSADGDIRIESAYAWPDGTTGPAIVLRFRAEHTHKVTGECEWDLQFSGSGLGPQTWINGKKWQVTQDVTRTAVDPP